ncbi:hypothetical protein LEMLEM_LOCUS24072 [Lemmus lemmus]
MDGEIFGVNAILALKSTKFTLNLLKDKEPAEKDTCSCAKPRVRLSGGWKVTSTFVQVGCAGSSSTAEEEQ